MFRRAEETLYPEDVHYQLRLRNYLVFSQFFGGAEADKLKSFHYVNELLAALMFVQLDSKPPAENRRPSHYNFTSVRPVKVKLAVVITLALLLPERLNSPKSNGGKDRKGSQLLFLLVLLSH